MSAAFGRTAARHGGPYRRDIGPADPTEVQHHLNHPIMPAVARALAG